MTQEKPPMQWCWGFWWTTWEIHWVQAANPLAIWQTCCVYPKLHSSCIIVGDTLIIGDKDTHSCIIPSQLTLWTPGMFCFSPGIGQPETRLRNPMQLFTATAFHGGLAGTSYGWTIAKRNMTRICKQTTEQSIWKTLWFTIINLKVKTRRTTGAWRTGYKFSTIGPCRGGICGRPMLDFLFIRNKWMGFDMSCSF